MQHAVEDEEDMSLRAPVIGQIARRILDDPHPYVAELAGAPARGSPLARMHGFRHARPVGRAERNVADLHARSPSLRKLYTIGRQQKLSRSWPRRTYSVYPVA